MGLHFAAGLISKYKNSGLILDTNLLLLVAVGDYDPRRISSFKRTSQFAISDFQLLQRVIVQFSRLCTTPNILTEVDNLGRQLQQSEWEQFSLSMRKLSLKLVEFTEASVRVTGDSRYSKLGLADTATILKLQSHLLLTDDLRLSGMATSAGLDAINFNHIRQFEP
jgi:hypothetical protein